MAQTYYEFVGDETGFDLRQLNGTEFDSAKRFAKGELILQVDETETRLQPLSENNTGFTIPNDKIQLPVAVDFQDLFNLLSAIVY